MNNHPEPNPPRPSMPLGPGPNPQRRYRRPARRHLAGRQAPKQRTRRALPRRPADPSQYKESHATQRANRMVIVHGPAPQPLCEALHKSGLIPYPVGSDRVVWLPTPHRPCRKTTGR